MRVQPRYSAVAMVLHWVIAGLILTNLTLGWRMGFLKGLAQFEMFQLHKSVGITVLVLSVARLGWRLAHPAPPLPNSMATLERLGARAAHWLFYVFMIVMPLTGWAMVSVSPYNLPTLLWHVVPWPHIGPLHDLPPSARAGVEAASGSVHMYLAFGGAALIAVHVAAALKHQFVTGDGVLGRMLPGLPRAPETL